MANPTKDEFVRQQVTRNNKATGNKMTPSQIKKETKTTESFWEKWFGSGSKK